MYIIYANLSVSTCGGQFDYTYSYKLDIEVDIHIWYKLNGIEWSSIHIWYKYVQI